MRSVFLVAFLAFGLTSLCGCSDAPKKQPSTEGAPPPGDSGSDTQKKSRPKPP